MLLVHIMFQLKTNMVYKYSALTNLGLGQITQLLLIIYLPDLV